MNETQSMMINDKRDWKTFVFGENSPAKTDGDTTSYKLKGYEEISNAMTSIVALM